VDQSIATQGSTDSSGFEVARQDFILNTDGKSVAEAKAKKHAQTYKKLKEAVKKHKAVFDLNYEKLSIAAKTYFLVGEKKGEARLSDAIDAVLSPLGLVHLKN
jgi:hypothetical protein